MAAVVTGGGSGIGLAVARRIIAEGGQVTLWDLDPRQLEAATSELGAQSRARLVDVTSPEDVERAADDANATMGSVDALVCSAGVAGVNAPVIDYPIAEWRRVFDVNVNGLFYCNRSVARLMKARGYGRIVNISSIAGKEGNPTASAYSASKAAVIGLTKSLGKELAKDGVTVNAIAPATLRNGRGGGFAHMLAGEPRMLVQHRRGLRPFRRPGHLSTTSWRARISGFASPWLCPAWRDCSRKAVALNRPQRG